MFFLVSNNKVISSGAAASLSEFKKKHPVPAGFSSFEYFEWPADAGSGEIYSTDGSTAGIVTFNNSSGATLPAGYTATQSITGLDDVEFIDPNAYLQFVGGITMPGSTNITGDELFNAPPINIYDKLERIQRINEVTETSIQMDPRLDPDITLANLQKVKQLESDNDFLEDGLGSTTSIQFELDDGSSDVLVFDSRKDTILDLIAIKNYSDLNQSIVNQSTQTAVSVTGIQTIDDEGTIKQLSPTEFDRMLYSLLSVFYENYTARVDMKNAIENPVGTTTSEQIAYLQSSSNVSFSVSKGSSFVSASSGK